MIFYSLQMKVEWTIWEVKAVLNALILIPVVFLQTGASDTQHYWSYSAQNEYTR